MTTMTFTALSCGMAFSTTVDVPGAIETQVFSINSKDEIVGLYVVDEDSPDHAFIGTPSR